MTRKKRIVMTSVGERCAAQRALAIEHAAWTSCATLATCSEGARRDARARVDDLVAERARATVAREKVAAWRAVRVAAAAVDAARDAAVARDARDARARETRAEVRAREARTAARAREGDGRRANAALMMYFRARDASETARRREAVERVRGETAATARELRLRAATSRTAPVVAPSFARVASATAAWLYRRAATMDEHFRVMDGELDVFERASRRGWILDETASRRATPSWRDAIPSR